ncbi:MAG: hypothetical protein U0T82_17210 [Bacteroidales bacterium]
MKTSDNSLWVICQGKVVYNNDWTQIIEETDSKLVRINTLTLEKNADVVIGATGDGLIPSPGCRSLQRILFISP